MSSYGLGFMQCFPPPQIHFILTKYFPDKSTGEPLWYKPGRNPLCLLSPHLCAHLLASKAKCAYGIKKGKEWGWWDEIGISGALLCEGISWSMEGEVKFGVSSCMVLLVERGTSWSMAHDTECPPDLFDMCICVFNVHVWWPDTHCDRNHQQSVWQAAIFHLFRLRWWCSLSLPWDLSLLNEC